MSTLKVDGIRSNSASSDAITLASDGTCSANITNNLSNRNAIINGAMEIDQRNGGSSITPTQDNVYCLDRFKTRLNVASKYSVQRVADAPSGLYNSLKVTSLAATTPGTNDYYQINQGIEGYNVRRLDLGSATAKQFTLSFWVKSSLTGTFGGAYSNLVGDRVYTWTYTISSANTWEKKSITITGATDGTWEKTTSAGLFVYWTLGAGSGVQTSAGSWGTSFKRGPSGATNVVATSGATWQITGVQLEVGDHATDFEYRSYPQELALCQRYLYVLADQAGGSTQRPVANLAGYTTSYLYGDIDLPVEMRIPPTIVSSSGTNYFLMYGGGGTTAVFAPQVYSARQSTSVCELQVIAATTNIVAGAPYFMRTNNASAYVQFWAEL